MASEKAFRIVGPRDPSNSSSYVNLPGGVVVEVGSVVDGTQEQFDAASVSFHVEEAGVDRPEGIVTSPEFFNNEKGGDE